MEIYLCCSYLSAIVYSAAMKTSVQISLWDPAFSSCGYVPGSEIARSCHCSHLKAI